MNDHIPTVVIVGFVALLIYGTLVGWFDGCAPAYCPPGEVQVTFYTPLVGTGYACVPRTSR